ncbi:aspartate aminotransferase family protein [Methylobacterium platani]|uniref:4-aminobutyrate aminotransferase n=2 Tax=Methylobacterium platani TaxID=427683 RepID=A0A179S1G9_9HYPH|nr:aspartate aminotransferase family protein [Methylobacterium platani]KMO18920.1 4-aminobutyrate aminotransferase [Methylobacterium platani JCM 14648]OAS19429.1 4-aminobutyrate aminotransferase [Methylobacterium platani]
MSMPNAFVPGSVALSAQDEALVARRARVLGPAYRLMYEEPLHFVRGEGVWLYDTEGRAFLDAYNNVASVGHCHPHVVEAIRRQVGTLATNTRYLHGLILDYAEKLLATLPAALGHVMFACTGSEANDLATRIARAYTGGTGIIITDFAYHGLTLAVSEYSPTLGNAVHLGSHVRRVTAPAAYRTEGDVAAAFEAGVRAAIADLHRHGIKPAMLIVDSLFTSDGILTEPTAFLKGAVDAIHEAGGLFVADEVQPGFGRTGDTMWGFQRHGVVPDMVTLGKPMGNGQPISGVVIRPEVVDSFGRNARYFNTFAGNAVSCAAALAVLEVIEREGLMANARDVGAYLLDGLKGVAARHEAVGDVRGAGLFAAVEIVADRASRAPDRELTSRVVNRMRQDGVLISVCGPGYNILKIRPPLVFTRENADTFVDVLDRALAAR